MLLHFLAEARLPFAFRLQTHINCHGDTVVYLCTRYGRPRNNN